MKRVTELLDFSGKVAVVTGSGMGIGRAIALRLAECGAKIAIGDINMAAARETLEAVRQLGSDGIIVEVDVSQPGQVSSFMSEVKESLGGINVLVNNAGIFNVAQSFFELDEPTWNKTLDTNLRGSFLCAQSAARIMIDSNQPGSIVNIASIAAFRPSPGLLHYDCSKHGIIGLTKNLALILASHVIRVNAIAPAGVKTPQTASFKMPPLSREEHDAEQHDVLSHIPLRRFAEADEIARVAVFLASDMSSMITGETILVDGGYSLI